MINEQTLELYVYVDGINDVPFLSNDYQEYILSNGEQFVTSDGKVFNVRILNENIIIHAFTYNAKRMGSAPTITTTIKYPECLDELFSQKVYATFNGEKYFLVATPSSSYSNEEIMYKHEATFVSERIALENTYFYDVVPENAEIDEPVSNNRDFVLSEKIDVFATRMNYSLQYAGLQVVDENGKYVSGYRVMLDEGISSEEKFMSVENKFFSEVLQEVYNTYDLPYYFVGKEIHIGYSTNAISEVFRYGDSDALVSITKSNANNRIINRATGIGSEENIPYYYPNVSPEGDIRVQLSDTNTGITNIDDIKIVDYKKFSTNIMMNNEYEFVAKPELFDFDFYGILDGQVIQQGRFGGEIDIYTDYSPRKKNVYFDISNAHFATKEIAELNTALMSQPNFDSIDWKGYGDKFPNGIIPSLELIDSSWIDSTDPLTIAPKFKVKEIRVLWIKEKFTARKVNNLTLYDYNLVDDKVISYSGAHHAYLFPDFADSLDNLNGEMGSTRMRIVWELDLDDYAKYTVRINCQRSEIGSDHWEHEGEILDLDNSGLLISGNPHVGDKFQKVLSENGWINPQKTLMPPIYRESLGAQRFYDAVSGVHIIPDENGLDSGLKYEFENEYNGHNPKEQIVQFEEIKPTIKEMRNSEGLRIDMFSEIAFDENDNDEMYETPNGTMKYKHPLFFAKLRKLDFNLFDSAIDSGEMTIALTDGSCSACEFKVAVDKDSKKNTVQVDENGNLVRYRNDNDPNDERNGDVLCGDEDRQTEVDPQDKQQDTINNEVWIALYKDKDTFGEIMPSVQNDLAPKACSTPTENDGDTFVILHISLPQAYIENAEKQLEQQIIYFIYDNNREKFNFSVKFSRIYFAEHPKILSLLDENSRITVEYNGIETQLYVSSITYKATENEILPEITVELKDEITVTQNQVQKATNQLKSEIYRTLYGIDVVAQGTRVFLRKDQPDTALQPITFKSNTNLEGGATVDKKIESKDYFEGSKGLSIHKDENGQWHIEADYLNARKKLSAKEVEIQKVYHISGAQIKSSASMICSRVADLGDAYRCWFDTVDDNSNAIYNQFIVGDQAYVQTFNLVNDNNGNTTNHFYWRLVEAVDANSITLSKTICADGSTTPMVGDNIVQLGYQGNDRPERQVAVIDAGAGEGAPYYRQFIGINSFALPEPETQLKPNDNKLKGQVDIKEGSLLSGIIAVKDENDDKIVAVINGADNLVDENGRKLVVATGVTNVEKEEEIITNIEATTKIYDDGTLTLGDKVGMSSVGNSDTDIRMWAGATEENKEDAPFRVTQDGKVVATNAEIEGKIKATEGELEKVVVKGSIRSPFSVLLPNEAELPDGTDNCHNLGNDIGSSIQETQLLWDNTQSGRRRLLTGRMLLKVPTNMIGKCYFYENGYKSETLRIYDEIVELVGYSRTNVTVDFDDNYEIGEEIFKGWIVLNRKSYGTNYPYGKDFRPLAFGRVKHNDSIASGATFLHRYTFDGNDEGLTIQRFANKEYHLTVPESWFNSILDCLVVCTIRNPFSYYSEYPPCSITASTFPNERKIVFLLWDANGESKDGEFDFILYPIKSWLGQ